MRYIQAFIVLCLMALLSACSFQGLYEKFVPANVRAMDDQYIHAVLNKDIEAFRGLQGDLSDEDFDLAIGEVFKRVPPGAVVYKEVISAEHNTTIDSSGKSKIINSSFEIQKGEQFLLINLVYNLDKDGKCCRLVRLNVDDYKTSPVKAGLDQAVKMGKIVGIVFLTLVLLGLFVLVTVIRRKKSSRT